MSTGGNHHPSGGAGADTPVAGALDGVVVVDASALGPGPFASMILADFGADVIEIRRPTSDGADPAPLFSRGKATLTVDLRAPQGAELISLLTDKADVFIESYRPGTMERRGLGPEVLMARNPRLVYTRLTGWGQDGPYAAQAGHDIDYVAIAGALGAIGVDGPVPALNILGDFAGGSLPAVMGILMALFNRHQTGRGQVIDASIVDGAVYLLMAQFGELGLGQWGGRGTSQLSGIAPYYTAYRCADGEWMAVGAIEPKFYRQLLSGLGLDPALAEVQDVRARWPEVRATFAAVFASQPRDHWVATFAGTDACAYPVLNLDEVADDPHVRWRDSVAREAGGGYRVGPAPRLSETPGTVGSRSPLTGEEQMGLLGAYGLSAEEIAGFCASGALLLAGS